MTKLICNGWEILFHPKFFGLQYQELFDRVTQLKQRLPDSEFKTHTTVKLFAALTIGIETKIPADPFASHFALTGPLKRYGRMKKMGLTIPKIILLSLYVHQIGERGENPLE